MIAKNNKAVVSSWIWIIGGVVVAAIVIIMGVSMMMRLQQNNQKVFAMDTYNNFVARVSTVCSQSTGNVDYYSLALPDVVKAMYVAKYSNEKPPDKVSVNITNLDTAQGKFICMQFFDENVPRCSKINCLVNMTYVGTPLRKNSLADMMARLTGKSPMYGYTLTILKISTDNVTIVAKRQLST